MTERLIGAHAARHPRRRDARRERARARLLAGPARRPGVLLPGGARRHRPDGGAAAGRAEGDARSDGMSRHLAIVPAYNEAGSVARTVAEIREHAAGFDVLVIDDGSTDATGRARGGGRRARDLGCPSTSASAARCSAATCTRATTATRSPCRSTATASTTRATSRGCSPRCEQRARVDMVTGSRFLDRQRRLPLLGRRGASASASSTAILSLITRQRVTDPTSGFRMSGRRGIELFARDYPHDYPEVEAILLLHAHRLRTREIAGRDAPAHQRALGDQRARSGLLHGQGAARGVRRAAARAPDARGPATRA